MGYLIEVTQGSNTNALLGFSKVMYEQNLNGTDWFDVLIDDTIDQDLTNLAADSEIKITRNGTVDIIGIIDSRRVLTNGVLRVLGLGKVDNKLMAPLAPVKRNSEWTSLNTNGVLGDIFAKAPSITLSVTDNVAVTSFATNQNMKVLQALDKWCRSANQYYSKNHSTLTVTVTNPTSSTSVGTLNEGIDFRGLDAGQDSKSTVKKVVVIGKGEGAAQITGSFSSGWVQGDAEEVITDKTIQSTAEANARAELEYNKLSARKDTYSFTVLDTTRNFTLGTVYTVNSAKLGSVDLRITSIKRTITQNGESLDLEVRTVSQREAAEDRLKQIAEGNRTYGDGLVFEQGDIVPLTYTSNDQAGSTSSKYAGGTFILPNWITSSSQILEAKLTIKRLDLKFATGTATGTGFASKVSNNPSVSGNAASHQHSIVNETPTTTSAGGASVVSSTGFDSTNGESISSLQDWTNTTISLSGGASDTSGMHCYTNFHEVYPNESVTATIRDILLLVRYRDDLGNTYPSSSGVSMNMTCNGVRDLNNNNFWTRASLAYNIIIPANTNGRTYTLQIKNSIASQVIFDCFAIGHRIGQHSHTVASHNHGAVTNSPSLSGNATSHDHSVDASGHSNPITQGVFNGTETNPLAIRYDVNASTANSAGNMSVGDVTTEFDIKAALNDPASSRTNNIFFYPTSNEAYLYAVVTIKAYRSE